MPITTLEIRIQRQPHGKLRAEARLSSEISAATSEWASEHLIVLNTRELVLLSDDATAYGQELGRQLFSDTVLRDAWLKARSFAASGRLQVRLRILESQAESGEDNLHAVRWEMLCAPDTQQPIALDERVSFVRTLDSSDLTPIIPLPRPKLRALLIVANPIDLVEFSLPEVDVDGEVARARSALGTIPMTILGGHSDATGRATLANVAKELRTEPSIVILVAHGTLYNGPPVLLLENDNGTADEVPGSDFVNTVARLPARPLLCILASCRSAGSGYGDSLNALGPQLAIVGVPAVLGFQGNISINSVKILLPTLITELRRDGQIDRAVAAARSTLHQLPDWWMAVLWLRTDGRLWQAPPSLTKAALGRLQMGTFLIVLTLALMGLGGVGYLLWPKALTPMGTGFNVAIAGIAVDDGKGNGLPDQRIGQELSDQLFQEIGKIDDIANLVGWRPYEGRTDGRSTSQGVSFISGSAQERAAQAAALAEQLQADVVIYGLIKVDAVEPGTSTYYPEIYVNQAAKDAVVVGEEILGATQFGAFINFNPTIDRGPEVEAFASRVDQLGYFLVGLQYYQSERLAEARESFCSALVGQQARSASPCDILAHPDEITLPDEAASVIYVFLGALEGRVSPPNITVALAHLEKAHQLWPAYARPFISKGTILYRQALALLSDTRPLVTAKSVQSPGQCFTGATTLSNDFTVLTSQTLTCFNEALTAAEQPANVDVRPKVLLSIASLSLVLVSAVDDPEYHWQNARMALDEVIVAYEQGDSAFQQRFRRYAGYAYGRRGLIILYYPSYTAPTEKSLEEYRQAAAYYRTALDLLQITAACRADSSACLALDQRAIEEFQKELANIEQRLTNTTPPTK
jgi:hypothetical protein